MEKSVKIAIEMLRPSFQQDGGDITLESVDEENGIISVSLSGLCSGCGTANAHIKLSVETFLKENITGITEVRVV